MYSTLDVDEWSDLLFKDNHRPISVICPLSFIQYKNLFLYPSHLFQMYSTQTETQRDEQLAGVVLAAQILSLGLWHARPHLRHQCGHNAPAPRYDNGPLFHDLKGE